MIDDVYFHSNHPEYHLGENGAVTLLSGGLDSTVAMVVALTEMPVKLAITFNYGQRAFVRELRASQAIAEHYKIPHRVIELPWLAELLPEALTPFNQPGLSEAAPDINPADFWDVRRVWVPNRNGLFINIAATLAEAYGYRFVIFGANAEEGESFPDNAPAFRDSMNQTLGYSTLQGVRVVTPVGDLNKKEILQRGIDLHVPLKHLWSCYEGTDTHCGRCPSCVRLKAAVEAARERGHQLDICFAG